MSTRLIVISVVASASAAVAVALNGRYIDRHLRNWHHTFQPHVVTISTIIAVRACVSRRAATQGGVRAV